MFEINDHHFYSTVRFAQFRPPLLALKPLFFQVPQQEDAESQFFWGRSWIFRDLATHLLPSTMSNSSSGSMEGSGNTNRRGVIISGATGSGKTNVALQLVEYSCFGRSRIPIASVATNRTECIYENPYATSSGESIYGRTHTPLPPAAETIQSLAARVVAYHFCQVKTFFEIKYLYFLQLKFDNITFDLNDTTGGK